MTRGSDDVPDARTAATGRGTEAGGVTATGEGGCQAAGLRETHSTRQESETGRHIDTLTDTCRYTGNDTRTETHRDRDMHRHNYTWDDDGRSRLSWSG
jgi:hypothetical protein